MANFLAGLCLVILGFLIYQFSQLFGLYKAQNDKGTPLPYLILLVVSFSLMASGAVMMVIGLL